MTDSEFVTSDLLPPGARSGPFDVVLANLPYVRAGELDATAGRPVSTTFEPRLALDGGDDGLIVIGRLLDQLAWALAVDGVALLEIGGDQGSTAPALVADRLPGLGSEVIPDLAGLPRVPAPPTGGSVTSTVIGSGLMPATLPVTPEQELPIRLIALDIDGTIIGDDHEIAERTTAAVRRAMERDVAVSLVTGPDGLVRDALRAGPGPDGTDRRLPGRAHTGDAACPTRDGSESC